MSANRERGDASTKPTVAKKTPLQSSNFWTGIFTVISAGFAYFSIYAETGAVQGLSEEAAKAVEAVQTKNYFGLIAVAVNVGNIIYHLFIKGRL